MIFDNPFKPNLVYWNDETAFQLPWKNTTPTDRANMFHRYQRLRNNSYGYIRRHQYYSKG